MALDEGTAASPLSPPPPHDKRFDRVAEAGCTQAGTTWASVTQGETSEGPSWPQVTSALQSCFVVKQC